MSPAPASAISLSFSLSLSLLRRGLSCCTFAISQLPALPYPPRSPLWFPMSPQRAPPVFPLVLTEFPVFLGGAVRGPMEAFMLGVLSARIAIQRQLCLLGLDVPPVSAADLAIAHGAHCAPALSAAALPAAVPSTDIAPAGGSAVASALAGLLLQHPRLLVATLGLRSPVLLQLVQEVTELSEGQRSLRRSGPRADSSLSCLAPPRWAAELLLSDVLRSSTFDVSPFVQRHRDIPHQLREQLAPGSPHTFRLLRRFTAGEIALRTSLSVDATATSVTALEAARDWLHRGARGDDDAGDEASATRE